MKELTVSFLKSKTLFSVLLNMVIIVLCVIITSFSYDGSVDYYNSINIAKNHFYYSNEINFILATLIGLFQYVITTFNCFVLAEIGLSFISFVSITFVLCDKFEKRRTFIFAIVINILFAINHYASINSSKTAAILLLAGFMLVLNAIRNKRYSLPCWIGIAEIIFGSFFDFKYFFISLGFAIAYFLGDLISKKKYRLDFRKLFWYFRPFMLMFILVTAVVFGLYKFSYNINNSTQEASDYYEYSELASTTERLPYPNYSDYKNDFEKVGIESESEYELLKNGYYDSDKSLNAEAMKLVQNIQKTNSTKTVLYAAGDVFTDIFSDFLSLDIKAVYTVFYFALAALFISFLRNRFILFPVFYLIAGYISSVFLRYYHAGEDYLIYGIWLHMIVLVIFSFNFDFKRRTDPPKFFKFKHKYMITSVAATIMLLTVCSVFFNLNSTESQLSKEPQHLIAEISRNPDKYYVMDTSSEKDFYKYTENYIHPLWGFRKGYLENLDSFGYLHNDNALRKRHLPENIYQSVLSNNKIYVIDKNIVFKKEKYFTDNYASKDKTVVYNQINDLDGYKIYEVTEN